MTHPIQQAIDVLMAVCDGARTRDMAGFNKADVALIRYDAAPVEVLDDAELAQRLVKYHRQLGEELTAELKLLAASGKRGADLGDKPGVLYVEEGHLKLYTLSTVLCDKALKQAGMKKYKHTEGFTYVKPPDRVLHAVAAGFNVAKRTVQWCAQQYGKPDDDDALF